MLALCVAFPVLLGAIGVAATTTSTSIELAVESTTTTTASTTASIVGFARDSSYEDGMTCGHWKSLTFIVKHAKLGYKDPTTSEECAQAVALDPDCGGHAFYFCSENGIMRPRPKCVCMKKGHTCNAEKWYRGSSEESCKVYNNGTALPVPVAAPRPPPTQVLDPQIGQAFWDRRLHLDHRNLHVLVYKSRDRISMVCELASLYYAETGIAVVVHRIYTRDAIGPCREGDHRSCDWQLPEKRVKQDEEAVANCLPELCGLIFIQKAWYADAHNQEFMRRDAVYGSMGGMDLYYGDVPLSSHLDSFDETSLLEDVSAYLDGSSIDWFSFPPVNRQGFSSSGRGAISIPHGSPQMMYLEHDEDAETLNGVMTWEEYIAELERLSTIDRTGDGIPDAAICAYTWGSYRFRSAAMVASSILQTAGLDENYIFDWKDTSMLLNSSGWILALNITRRLVSLMGSCYGSSSKAPAKFGLWAPKSKKRRTLVGSSVFYNRETQELETCSPSTCPYALKSTDGSSLINVASPMVAAPCSWNMNAKSLRKKESWSFIEFTQREDVRFIPLLKYMYYRPWMTQDFDVSLWKKYEYMVAENTPKDDAEKRAEYEALENNLEIGRTLLFDTPLFNLHPYKRVGGPFWYQSSSEGLLGWAVDNAIHPDAVRWEEATQEMQVLNDLLYSLFGMLGTQTHQLMNAQAQILKLPTRSIKASEDSASAVEVQPTIANTCIVGYYKVGILADFCFPCPKGFLASLPEAVANGAAACQMCPRGKYQGVKGSVRCQECRPGRTTLSSGAVKESECTETELHKAPLQYDLAAHHPAGMPQGSVDFFWSLDAFHPPDQSTKEADVNIIVAMAWKDARLPEILGPRAGVLSIAEWRERGLWLPDFTVRGTTYQEFLEDFVEVTVSMTGATNLVTCKRQTSVRLHIDWPLLNWDMFPFGEQTLPIEFRCEPVDISCTCTLCDGQSRRLQTADDAFPQCAEDALRAQNLERRLATKASAGKVIAASKLSSASGSATGPVASTELQFHDSTNALTVAAMEAWPQNWPYLDIFREDQISGYPFRIVIRVERKSELSFVRTIIPAFLTCLLTMLVFMTDDLYNQLNLAFQCLLILAVYATEVSNSIPDHVTYLSWLDIYIFGNLILQGFLTFIAVIITVLDEKEKHRLAGVFDRTACLVMIPMVIIANVGMMLAEDLDSMKSFLYVSCSCALGAGLLLAIILASFAQKSLGDAGIYNQKSLLASMLQTRRKSEDTQKAAGGASEAAEGSCMEAAIGKPAVAEGSCIEAAIGKPSQIEAADERLTQNGAGKIFNLDEDEPNLQVQSMLSELLARMANLEGKLERKVEGTALTETTAKNSLALQSTISELAMRLEKFDQKVTMLNDASALLDLAQRMKTLEDTLSRCSTSAELTPEHSNNPSTIPQSQRSTSALLTQEHSNNSCTISQSHPGGELQQAFATQFRGAAGLGPKYLDLRALV